MNDRLYRGARVEGRSVKSVWLGRDRCSYGDNHCLSSAVGDGLIGWIYDDLLRHFVSPRTRRRGFSIRRSARFGISNA